MLMAVMLLAAAQPSARHKIARSVRSFEHCFDDLSGAGKSINPLERVLFSLAVATATPADQ
jgi:hypothetical protein